MGDRTSVLNSKILAVWYASEAENLFNLQYASKTYTSWRNFVYFPLRRKLSPISITYPRARIHSPCKLKTELFPDRKKQGSITYSTNRENDVSKTILTLGSNSGEDFNQQTFEFSGRYNQVRPAKLTNHNAHTN